MGGQAEEGRRRRGARPAWVGPREWLGHRGRLDTALDDGELLLHAGWRRERPLRDGGPPAPAVLEREWAPRLREGLDRPVAPAALAALDRAFPADRRVLVGPLLAVWARVLAEGRS